MFSRYFSAAVVVITFLFFSTAHAQSISVEPVVTGLKSPIGVYNAGDGSGRLFIVQQGGQVAIWDGTRLLPTPFLFHF